MNIRFDEKTVWLTGGAGGIGQSIAKEYLEAGANVRLLDVSEERLQQAKENLNSDHLTISTIDLTDPNAIEQVVDTLNEKVDILVNAAGFMEGRGMSRMTVEKWDMMFNVNVRGSFFLSKYVSEKCMNRNGSIVMFSSAAAIRGFEGNMASPHYAASKGALISMARQMAVDLCGMNVNVNAVVPGGVLTPAMKAMGFDNEEMTTIPLKRLCNPEEIAYTVLFLTSTQGHMITGQAIVIDGGANIVGQ